MAEKPVIVPVNLEVTDVDLSKVDVNQVNKDISQKLAGVRKAVNDIFSSVDTTKLSKPVASALASLRKDIKEVTSAQSRFNDEMSKAGATSETYKKDSEELARLQSELEKTIQKMKLFQDQSL